MRVRPIPKSDGEVPQFTNLYDAPSIPGASSMPVMESEVAESMASRHAHGSVVDFPGTFEFPGISNSPQVKASRQKSVSRKLEQGGMSDSDVRRLEDRIEAVSREGQLRLDAVMARIDGQLGRIADQNSSIKHDLDDMRSDLRASRSDTRTWGFWVMGTVIATGIALAGLFVGVKQIWIGGVQVGQQISAPASTQVPAKP